MNRHIVLFTLVGISGAATVCGWNLGKSVQPMPRAFLFAVQPRAQVIALTVRTSDGKTHQVSGTWDPMSFDNDTLTVAYTSDRLFCSGMESADRCSGYLP